VDKPDAANAHLPSAPARDTTEILTISGVLSKSLTPGGCPALNRISATQVPRAWRSASVKRLVGGKLPQPEGEEGLATAAAGHCRPSQTKPDRRLAGLPGYPSSSNGATDLAESGFTSAIGTKNM
jgi:hypothetical protein